MLAFSPTVLSISLGFSPLVPLLFFPNSLLSLSVPRPYSSQEGKDLFLSVYVCLFLFPTIPENLLATYIKENRIDLVVLASSDIAYLDVCWLTTPPFFSLFCPSFVVCPAVYRLSLAPLSLSSSCCHVSLPLPRQPPNHPARLTPSPLSILSYLSHPLIPPPPRSPLQTHTHSPHAFHRIAWIW